LFSVADYWSNTGRAGLLIYQYRLHALHSTSQEGLRSPAGNFTPDRMTSVVQRLVRGTAVTRWAKNLYDCTCQVCGARLETASGPYAEGAHIRPLGRPHSGPDVLENVLVLCPNDHVLSIGARSTSMATCRLSALHLERRSGSSDCWRGTLQLQNSSNIIEATTGLGARAGRPTPLRGRDCVLGRLVRKSRDLRYCTWPRTRRCSGLIEEGGGRWAVLAILSGLPPTQPWALGPGTGVEITS
jgi:hypothetical protein